MTATTIVDDQTGTMPVPAATDEARDALVGRIFESTLGMMDIYAIYLGDRLGLYRALSDGNARTSTDLAAATGTHERYIREWLEQQAVSGILVAEDQEAAPTARRYRLPAGHREVLTNADSPAYMTPLARMGVAAGRVMPPLLEAFQHGGGVSYEAYGADAREGQADFGRVTYLGLLGTQWLPSMPDLDARLRAAPPARVADVACGAGWSSIAIAQAYPLVQVTGFDSDEASIELARANAEAAGLSDRVRFAVRDAATLTPAIDGTFDLVCVFEAIHDMAQPVPALRAARSLARAGTVLVMDERVPDTFSAPGDDLDRFFYGASVFVCLPTGMAQEPSAGTGTVMRTSTFREYATAAGFQAVDVLPIEHDFYRFYRLTP